MISIPLFVGGDTLPVWLLLLNMVLEKKTISTIENAVGRRQDEVTSS